MCERWMRNASCFLLIVVLILTIGCGNSPTCEVTVYGTRVRFFQKENWKSVISPHTDKRAILQVGQQQFENVRGYGCRFNQIEELRAILFVTEESAGVFVHAFDLTKGVDVKAPLGAASGFGHWIGSSNQQYEAVTLLSSNALLLSIFGQSYLERTNTRWDFVFDLEQKAVRLPRKSELGK